MWDGLCPDLSTGSVDSFRLEITGFKLQPLRESQTREL